MHLIVILLFSLQIQQGILDKQIMTEYTGGIPFSIWANLKLYRDGKFEYQLATHQSVYLQDKGRWRIEKQVLVLESSKKVKKNYRGKEVGRSRFLFKGFRFEISDDKIKYMKKNNFTFRGSYFHMMEREVGN